MWTRRRNGERFAGQNWEIENCLIEISAQIWYNSKVMSLCFQTNIPGLPEHTSQNRCLINSNRLGKPSQQILSVCFCARCCRSCEDQIHLEGIVPFLCMGACVFVSEAPSLLSHLVSVTPQGWTGASSSGRDLHFSSLLSPQPWLSAVGWLLPSLARCSWEKGWLLAWWALEKEMSMGAQSPGGPLHTAITLPTGSCPPCLCTGPAGLVNRRSTWCRSITTLS